jgi:maltooligosyltrehalose trehalohydrolase
MMAHRLTSGATLLHDNRCRFLVWAPHAKRVEVVLLWPRQKVLALRRQERGYHHAVVEGVKPGARYLYRLDGQRELPDPASRFQPDGVHGPSAVVDAEFAWRDEEWSGVPLRDCILYELHVGTFTPEGTFAAAIKHLPELRELGITALELMPVAQFPGSRNWGYDGVYPYAVQNSYGGPAGLKRLVNAAHRAGLAVVLDVVYNHVGPEGNHLGEFGPYFTDSYHTPWGRGLNFDGPGSDGVRRFFIENAFYWQTEFHIDALRLDAIPAIRDSSPTHFLAELARACRRRAPTLSRPFYLIGESGLDIIRHLSVGGPWGCALDAEWRDDFHHCLHALLTREQTGYYARFGGVHRFARAWKATAPARAFVAYSQNHDQVGNRLRGERLAALVSFEARKLAAATVLLSPSIPLLFMGEEYGETAPFRYFISHSNRALIRAVRDGRRAEASAFGWRGRPPDPQAAVSFESSRLNRALMYQPRHRLLREFYRKLIRLRRTVPALVSARGDAIQVLAHRAQAVLLVRYLDGGGQLLVAFNYSDKAATVTAAVSPGRWRKLLDSASRKWGGPGSRVPDEVRSASTVTLNLPEKSVLVLVQE